MKPSAQSNDTALAGDANSTVRQRNGEMHQTCAHCQAEIVDRQWFCRLPGNEGPTLLCSSSCALRHFSRSHGERNGPDQDWDSREPRFHFFVKSEAGDSAEPIK